MSQNSFGSPIIYLKGKELSYNNITFTDSGNNMPTTLTVTSKEIDLLDDKLFNSDIVMYLNAGSHDDVAFFRGKIRDITPGETKITIKAIDAIGLLTGSHATKLTLTDENNYDGYSLTAFLIDYITKNININETIIGLDFVNEITPSVTLSNYRGKKTPLQVVKDNIKSNTSNLNDITNFKLGLIDDGSKSQLVFRKQQSLSNSSVKFNYTDGIRTISYKKRNPPNIIAGEVDGITKKYQHNTLPTGPNVKNVKAREPFRDPDSFKKHAFLMAHAEETRNEISITVDKGYYLDVGNVIYMSLEDYPDLIGKHRITGKTLNVSSGIKCTLKLSRETPEVSNYLGEASTVVTRF